MSSTVSVIGFNPEMGGLKESTSKFAKHHAEVGDALLNISGIGAHLNGPVDKDEPRPAYVRQPWPKHTYHADGRDLIVADKDELRAAEKQGFRTEPYPKVQIALGDPKAEKKAMQDRITEQDGKIATLMDTVQKLMAKLGENG